MAVINFNFLLNLLMFNRSIGLRHCCYAECDRLRAAFHLPRHRRVMLSNISCRCRPVTLSGHVVERKEKHSGKAAGRSGDWRRRLRVRSGKKRLPQSRAVDARGHRRASRSRCFCRNYFFPIEFLTNLRWFWFKQITLGFIPFSS